jgi:uncharacterized protein involved in exopolysaccharide biosynthesis
VNQTDHSDERDEKDRSSSNSGDLATERIFLNELWFEIWRRRILVLSVTTVFVLLSSLVAFLLTPIYRADVLMAYTGHGEKGGGLTSLMSQYANVASLAGLNLEAPGSRKNEAIATLLSRSFTLQFIDSMKIMSNLFPQATDENRSNGDTMPTRGEAFKRFDKQIRKVVEDKKTGLVTLSIDFDDRFLAAEWANSMVSLVNASLRQRAIEESEQSIEFLTLELEKTGPEELRQSIYDLIEGHIANIMLANVHEQYAFKVIDPAVVPDEDSFERPKRLLIIISGVIVGLLLGLFIACLRAFSVYNPRRRHRTTS